MKNSSVLLFVLILLVSASVLMSCKTVKEPPETDPPERGSLQTSDTDSKETESDTNPPESETIPAESETEGQETDPAETRHYVIPTKPEDTDETPVTTDPETESETAPIETKPGTPERVTGEEGLLEAIRSLNVKTINGTSWVLYEAVREADGSCRVIVMVNKGDRAASVRTDYRYDGTNGELTRISQSEEPLCDDVEESIWVMFGDYEVFWR